MSYYTYTVTDIADYVVNTLGKHTHTASVLAWLRTSGYLICADPQRGVDRVKPSLTEDRYAIDVPLKSINVGRMKRIVPKFSKAGVKFLATMYYHAAKKVESCQTTVRRRVGNGYRSFQLTRLGNRILDEMRWRRLYKMHSRRNPGSRRHVSYAGADGQGRPLILAGVQNAFFAARAV